MSEDQTVIVGTGTNPEGNLEAWRADLGCVQGVSKQSSAACECAAVFTWVNGASFHQPANWDPEGPPGDDAVASFNLAASPVDVGFTEDAVSGALQVLDGRVTLNLDGYEYAITGLTGCQPGLTVQGERGDTTRTGDYLDLKGGSMLVGEEARVGSELDIEGGHELNVLGDVLIGRGGEGRVAVFGEGSTLSTGLSAGSKVTVGDTETGELWLSDGASADFNHLVVGDQAEGYVIVDGGSTELSVDDVFEIGGGHIGVVHVRNFNALTVEPVIKMATAQGGYGVLLVEGGNEDISSSILLGKGAEVGIADTAFVILQDHALVTVFGEMKLGVGPGGVGTLEISEASLTMDAGVNAWLQVGAGGEGWLAMKDATADLRKLTIGSAGIGEAMITRSSLTFEDEFSIDGTDVESKMTLADGSTLENLEHDVIIGRAGKGRLDVRGGSEMTLFNRLVVGNATDGEGTVTLSGAGTTLAMGLVASSEVIVGHEGKGDVQITEGAVADLSNVWVGKEEGGYGSVFVGGVGTELDAKNLAVGTGDFGLLQVDQAAQVQTTLLWIGDNGHVSGPILSVGTFSAPSKRIEAGLAAGTLLLSENAQLDVDSLALSPEAVLGGTATWPVPITNTGGISPGDLVDPAGTFTAGAGYTQAAEGTLYIDLATGASDRLNVTGTAVLDGTLEVTVVPGSSLRTGDTFTILAADDVTGIFARIEPQVGLEIEVIYRTTEVIARILSYDATAVAVEQPAESQLPVSFQLYQNYPNPFNPQTMIRYEVSEPGAVRLAVYDVVGREVRRLVDTQQAAGRYEVVFEAGDLPSGVYFYTLIVGQHVASVPARRMVLLR